MSEATSKGKVIEIICSPCRYAADTGDQKAHEMCKDCACQHHPRGYGRPELSANDKRVLAAIDRLEAPQSVPLDEWKKAALDSVGLTLNELRDKIQSWSADGQELLAWRVVNGEAA